MNERLLGSCRAKSCRGVVPQIGFKNALNTMGLNLSITEMLDLYNRRPGGVDVLGEMSAGLLDLFNRFVGMKYQIPPYFSP